MRHKALWTLVLLGLPQIAAAQDPSVVVPIFPGGEPEIESAEAPGTASSPEFDLRIDPSQLPSSGNPSSAPGAVEGEQADRYTGADQRSADRGLSLGLEVKPRSGIGSLARKDDTETPSLQQELQRLIERPTFGVRGRYRF